MKNMTLLNIVAVCHGTYYGDQALLSREIAGVAIDSRKIEPDFLFVPLRGARVDGHSFIPQVMAAGALATLSEEELDGADYPYIRVASCLESLKALAAFYRNSLHIKVVGITGSVGKTSTKEMIASVLSQKYRVLKTEGNYNNEIGLPLTIFNIREEHEVAVLEMGIDHFGEMHSLASMSQPDVCVITNIGLAHIENLGSRDGILRAKTEVFDHLKPGATVILNGDDDKLASLCEVQGRRPVFFGLSSELDAYADQIENLGLKGTSCTLHIPGTEAARRPAPFGAAAGCGDSEQPADSSLAAASAPEDVPGSGAPDAASVAVLRSVFRARIPIPGAHMVYNALAGACCGVALGLSPEEIRCGIEAIKTIAGRTNLIDTGSFLIIDDCYNANPVSMRGSLDILSHGLGRTVAVMGDMFELGDTEKELHYNTGVYAAEKGIDVICCVGGLSRHTYDGARARSQGSAVLYFEDRDDFLRKIQNVVRKGDTILVKASHGMEFPAIVERLKELS